MLFRSVSQSRYRSHKAEELREKWGVESGQLWKLGEHRLICGDCTDKAVVERVMQGEVAGLIFADPPYGMNLDTKFANMHKANEFGKGGKNYEPVIGDNVDFDPTPIMAYFSEVEEQFWWGADYYRKLIPDGGGWLVWDKRHNDQEMKLDDLLGSHFELCWSMQPHKREIIRILWAGHHGMQREDTKKRVHPNQKPTSLVEWVLERYYKVGCVVDPFLGSGTTLIACERLGRKCRAVEISPAYCAVAIQRWVDVTGKEPVLLSNST